MTDKAVSIVRGEIQLFQLPHNYNYSLSVFQLLIQTTTGFAFKTDENTKVSARDKAEESGIGKEAEIWFIYTSNMVRRSQSCHHICPTVPYTLANHVNYYCLGIYCSHTEFMPHIGLSPMVCLFWGQQAILYSVPYNEIWGVCQDRGGPVTLRWNKYRSLKWYLKAQN